MGYLSAKSKLRINKSGLYYAGYPNYRRNFSRDSLTYGLLASDKDALIAQIEYSARHQGKKLTLIPEKSLARFITNFQLANDAVT